MRLAKKILLVSGILFIVLQFIRPVHNKSGQVLTTDISKVITIPDTVLNVLKNACYDCHSNNTNYPWYSNIQPMAWLMAYHIKKAKNQLNFSEFGSYSQRRQLSRLDGIANSIKDDIMPLNSYKLMHKSAQLNNEEKSLLINWAQQSIDSISGINLK
jgi:Haem-binding domain